MDVFRGMPYKENMVECMGLPPHAWSESDLHKIGNVWGPIVRLDEATVKGESFGGGALLHHEVVCWTNRRTTSGQWGQS